MNAFEWSAIFETGLPDVDAQHKNLVNMVNVLCRESDTASSEQVDILLKKLADYTVYHFQCEERIMAEAAVDKGYTDAHIETHRRFVQQVVQWIELRSGNKEVPLVQVLDALANWLVYHILGDDQSMARQVRAVQRGVNPHDAYAQDHSSEDPRTDILLGAFRHLYSDLERRNDELFVLNTNLEQRVNERTAQLSAVNRMEALGSLAGGIAHEINTPTQYIHDNIAFMKESTADLLELAKVVRSFQSGQTTANDLADKVNNLDLDYLDTELPAAADQALHGTTCIRNIVLAIKEFAYPSSKSSAPIDLNHLIHLVATVSHNQWKNLAEIVFDLDPVLPKIIANEGEINQMLLNIIVNAAQAIEEKHVSGKGKITVTTRSIDGGVQLTVGDTGKGIPPENMKFIFDMFFTTKLPGQGTGQGLAITQSIVHRHGGRIWAMSEPDNGSEFHVWLPLDGSQTHH